MDPSAMYQSNNFNTYQPAPIWNQQNFIYFRAITTFTGLDNITRLDTAIFSGPDPDTSFKFAHCFVMNKGNQLQNVFYDPNRIAIQKWQNGINQGVVFGDPNLLHF